MSFLGEWDPHLYVCMSKKEGMCGHMLSLSILNLFQFMSFSIWRQCMRKSLLAQKGVYSLLGPMSMLLTMCAYIVQGQNRSEKHVSKAPLHGSNNN